MWHRDSASTGPCGLLAPSGGSSPRVPPPQTVSLSCFTASKDVRQLLLGMDFYLHTMQAHHESVICKNVGSRIFQMLRHFIKITFVKIATNLVRGHH